MNENLVEKVSVNMNTSTLSSIDILVDNGYFSNRSDFINQAVREALQKQQTVLDRIINAQTAEQNDADRWFVGLYGIEKHSLERLKEKGKKIRITGYGVLTFEKEIEDALIFETVDVIRVKGKVVCSDSVRQHYGIRK